MLLQAELDKKKAAAPVRAAAQQPNKDDQDLLQKLQEAEAGAAALTAERDHAKQQLSRLATSYTLTFPQLALPFVCGHDGIM